jgi:cytochrome c oxidase subunit 3
VTTVSLPSDNAPAPTGVSPTDRWRGGVSPYGVSWQKLMMWWFIVSDALLFGGFLTCYGFDRIVAGTWPDRTEVFHGLGFITAMTFVLITSSATMACAVSASRKGDSKNAGRFLLATLIGGVSFLGMQAFEWAGVIGAGATLSHNPWGVASFGSYFFLITGFHGTHVLIGAIILLLTAIGALRGKATAGGIELAGLYWHFVDLVWVFVFGTFYLV